MCDNPTHRTNNPDHEMLHKIVDDLAVVKGKVVNLETAMYGTGTTKGLVTKLDEIRTGQTDGAKAAGAWSGGIVAVLVGVIVGVLQFLGVKGS